MGRYWSVSATSSLALSCLLLLSINGGMTRCLAQGCSSSCGGDSPDIHYPFRIKGDPPGCGDPNYELVCKGNKTILNWKSNENEVAEIQYDYSYEKHLIGIRVVDVNFASGSCRLPRQSLQETGVVREGGSQYIFQLNEPLTASFVNCSKKVDDSGYRLVSCLSGTDFYIYVVYSDSMSDLRPPCHYLVKVKVPLSSSSSSDEDIFQVLREGFYLYASRKALDDALPSIVYCWKKAFEDPGKGLMDDKGFNWLLNRVSGEFLFVRCVFPSIGVPGGIVLTSLLLIIQLLVGLALIGRFIVAPLCIFIFLVHKLRGMNISVDNVEKFLQEQQSLTPKKYAYSEIIAMTGHFREKLGQGGFGTVFKGRLPGGYLVAIKMLGNSKGKGEDFINEVSTIGRIHHVNVVRLIGFCSEGPHRALVYEYMPNGSLDKYIFSEDHPFPGETLVKIALGIARGIEYLHLGCDMRIVHFDIKPYNILLDSNFTPKVSDFGLARLYSKDNSLVSVSVARGTIGYIAPELISKSFGLVTTKSDVYSFGMLLLEMAGGRKNVNPQAENSSEIYFPLWIYDQLNRGEEQQQIENATSIDEHRRKLYLVGLWCIQMKSSVRPSMSEVVQLLEGSTDVLPMPPKPFLSSPEPMVVEEYSFNSSSITESSILPSC